MNKYIMNKKKDFELFAVVTEAGINLAQLKPKYTVSEQYMERCTEMSLSAKAYVLAAFDYAKTYGVVDANEDIYRFIEEQGENLVLGDIADDCRYVDADVDHVPVVNQIPSYELYEEWLTNLCDYK
nr:MAG TPA: hypothetical protein [Caudoviricetes sp.]